MASADVDSTTWELVEQFPSLDAFDVIVVDFTTVGPEELNYLSQRQVELRRFMFSPNAKDGAELIIVGHHMYAQYLVDTWPGAVPLQGVGALDFDLPEDLTPDLQRWFARVDRLDFGYHQNSWTVKDRMEPHDVVALGTMRSGLTAGFTLFHWDSTIGQQSLPVIWLPPVTKGTVDQAILDLLHGRFGVTSRAAVPDWLSHVPRLPNHEALVDREEALRVSISKAELELADTIERVEVEAAFGGLLYEQGTSLEQLVWAAFRLLQADVHEPSEKGVQDAWIQAPNGQWAAVEVKGVKNQAGRKDVRELDDWVERAKETHGDRSWQGLLVTNAECQKPPSERGQPLAPNALELLNSLHFCAVTTQEIYDALRELQLGTFDEIQWWAAKLSQPHK